MRKFLLSCFAMALLFSTTIFSVSAASQDDENLGLKIETEDGQEVLVDSVEHVTYSQAFLADGTPVSLEMFKQQLEEKRRNENQMNQLAAKAKIAQTLQPNAVIDASYYENLANWSVYENPIKVSADVDCRTSSQDCSIAYADTVTTTEEFSADITAGDEKFVKASAGFTWSTSSSSQLTYTLYVSKTHVGHLVFSPLVNYTRGNIHYIGCYDTIGCQDLGEKDNVWGSSPQKLPTGHTDGIFAIANVA